MQLVRALLFALIFYPGTLLFVLLGIVAGAIGTAPMLRVVYGWAHFHHWLAHDLFGIRTEINMTVGRQQATVTGDIQREMETLA